MSERSRHTPVFLYNAAAAETCWRPSVDIYRTRTGWLLKFDLAGVQMEDVTVQVQGCKVKVTGVRRDLVVEDGWTHYAMEIAYNRFERTVELPCDLAHPTVSVEGRNGILIVRVDTEGENK